MLLLWSFSLCCDRSGRAYSSMGTNGGRPVVRSAEIGRNIRCRQELFLLAIASCLRRRDASPVLSFDLTSGVFELLCPCCMSYLLETSFVVCLRTIAIRSPPPPNLFPSLTRPTIHPSTDSTSNRDHTAWVTASPIPPTLLAQARSLGPVPPQDRRQHGQPTQLDQLFPLRH